MLTHLDAKNDPTMVDVSDKSVTERQAIARTEMILPKEVMDIFNGDDFQSKKGPVIQTAIIGGTMAVKKTSELIPFCHPLLLESIKFKHQLKGNILTLDCMVKMTGKTGVEMEALQGVSQAALIVYDMLKAVTHDIKITNTYLIQKSGGKRDFNREAHGHS